MTAGVWVFMKHFSYVSDTARINCTSTPVSVDGSSDFCMAPACTCGVVVVALALLVWCGACHLCMQTDKRDEACCYGGLC